MGQARTSWAVSLATIAATLTPLTTAPALADPDPAESVPEELGAGVTVVGDLQGLDRPLTDDLPAAVSGPADILVPTFEVQQDRPEDGSPIDETRAEVELRDLLAALVTGIDRWRQPESAPRQESAATGEYQTEAPSAAHPRTSHGLEPLPSTSAEVPEVLSGGTRRTRLGQTSDDVTFPDLPITITPPTLPAGTDVELQVGVLDAADAFTLSPAGLAFTLDMDELIANVDGRTHRVPFVPDAAMSVAIDTSRLPLSAGGEAIERLRVVRVAGCLWEDDADVGRVPVCDTIEPVEARLDIVGSTLTFAAAPRDFVPEGQGLRATPTAAVSTPGWRYADPGVTDRQVLLAQAGSGGGWGGYAVTTGASGPSGDFQPPAPAISAGVAEQRGSVSLSYGVALAPSQAGPAPSLSLDYDSLRVDGMNVATNNQPGPIGIGWALGGLGGVTRHFSTCTDSPFQGQNCLIASGAKDEYSVAFGGVAGRLAAVNGTSDEFRVVNAPGWRVMRKTGGLPAGSDHADHHNAWWTFESPDGLTYTFGRAWYDDLEGEGGLTNLQSTQWTWAREGTTLRKFAYEWSLDRVEDRFGNVMRVRYEQELNYFLTDGVNRQYVRAGLPSEITYGENVSAAGVHAPTAMARLNFELRCTDPRQVDTCSQEGGTNSDFADTPFDLRCNGVGACTSNTSTTSWSDVRLTSIDALVRFTDGKWRLANTTWMRQYIAGSSAKTWLSQIHRIASSGVLDGNTPQFNAASPIEAERFTWENSGVDLVRSENASHVSAGATHGVSHVYVNKRLRFEDVDFGNTGGMGAILLNMSSKNVSAPKVHVWIDNALVATLNINDTGGWLNYKTTRLDFGGTHFTGVKDVEFRFENGPNSGAVANLNWFRLVPRSVPGTRVIDGFEAIGPVDFGGIELQNRVNPGEKGPMNMLRVDRAANALGADTHFTYGQKLNGQTNGAACPAAGELLRQQYLCFHAWDANVANPNNAGYVRWNRYNVLEKIHYPNGLPGSDLAAEIHPGKTQLSDDVGQLIEEYDYEDIAFAYDLTPGSPDINAGGCGTTRSCRTWTDYRGFGQVTVTTRKACGNSQRCTLQREETRYFTGLHNDRKANWGGDEPHHVDNDGLNRANEVWLTGLPYRSTLFASTGDAVETTHTRYQEDVSVTTGPTARLHTRVVAPERVRNVPAGGTPSRSLYDYDQHGNVTEIADHGFDGIPGDELLTVHDYKINVSGWMKNVPAKVEVFTDLAGNSRRRKVVITADNASGAVTDTDVSVGTSSAHVASTQTSNRDAFGRVLTRHVVDQTPASSPTRTSKWTFDNHDGTVATVTDMLGSKAHTTTYTVDPRHGGATRTQSPDGIVTHAAYDGFARVVEITHGNNALPDTEYRYLLDNVPPLVKRLESVCDPTAAGNTNGCIADGSYDPTFRRVHQFLDGDGAVIQTQTPHPSDPRNQHVVTASALQPDSTIAYDPVLRSSQLGGLTAYLSTVPSNTTRTEIRSELSGTTATTTTTVFPSGGAGVPQTTANMTAVAGGSQQTVTEHGDGTVADVTTITTTDVHGSPTSVQIAGDLTTFSYNSLGERLSATHGGITSTWANHDWAGRARTSNDPSFGQRTYEFDGFGDLVTYGKAGATLNMQFDALGRLTTTKQGNSLLRRNTYSTTGNMRGRRISALSKTSRGDLTMTVESVSSRGTPTSVRWDIPGTPEQGAGTYRAAFGYNTFGALETTAFPSGPNGSTGAIDVHEVVAGSGASTGTSAIEFNNPLNDPALDLIRSVQRDHRGNVKSARLGATTHPATAQSTATYDDLGQLTMQRVKRIGLNQQTVMHRFYEFDDASGQLLTRREPGIAKECFVYDNHRRLDEAYTVGHNSGCGATRGVGFDGYEHDYQFSASGNLTNTGERVVTYSGFQPVADSSGDTYSYDNRGNLTAWEENGTTRSLTYDALDQLLTLSAPAGAEEHLYDADGNRIVRSDGDGHTVFLGSIYERRLSSGTSAAIPDPSFETGTGWVDENEQVGAAGATGASSIRRTNWGIHSASEGARALSINNLHYGSVRSDAVPVGAAATVRADAWLRGEMTAAAGGKIEVRVFFYSDLAGTTPVTANKVDTARTLLPNELSGGTWNQFGGLVNLPLGTQSVRLDIQSFNNDGWIGIDDGKIRPDNAGPNLLPNAGFESGPWSELASQHYPATSISRNDWAIHKGRNDGFSTVITNVAYGTVRSDAFPITAGTEYTVEVDAKGAHGPASGLNTAIKVYWYDDSAGQMSPVNNHIAKKIQPGALSTQHTRHGGNVTAPNSATHAEVWLVSRMADGHITFDNVAMEVATGGPNLAPGNGTFSNVAGWMGLIDDDYAHTTIWRNTSFNSAGNHGWTISNLARGYSRTDQPIAVTPNQTHVIEFDVKGVYDTGTTGSAAGARIGLFDSNGPTQWLTTVAAVDLSTNYTTLQATFTPTTNAVRIGVAGMDLDGWVTFDNLRIIQGTTTDTETLYHAGPGGMVVETRPTASATFGTFALIATDYQGSASVQIDAITGTKATRRYLPFGGPRTGDRDDLTTDRGYTGHVEDASTLTYMNARFYNPAVGAFITPDTYLGGVSYLNRYAYVAGNPINRIDPSGHKYVIGRAQTGGGITSGSGAERYWPMVGHGMSARPATSGKPAARGCEGSCWKMAAKGLANVGAALFNDASDLAALASANPFGGYHLPHFEDQGVGGIYGTTKVVAAAAGAAKAGPALARGLRSLLRGGTNTALTAAEAARSVRPPGRYARPSGATTAAQRSSVQDLPCVECGAIAETQVADHIYPLVQEYYETGAINLERMRSLEAVQPMCPTCSASQGGRLSWWSRAMREFFGFG